MFTADQITIFGMLCPYLSCSLLNNTLPPIRVTSKMEVGSFPSPEDRNGAGFQSVF